MRVEKKLTEVVVHFTMEEASTMVGEEFGVVLDELCEKLAAAGVIDEDDDDEEIEGLDEDDEDDDFEDDLDEDEDETLDDDDEDDEIWRKKPEVLPGRAD